MPCLVDGKGCNLCGAPCESLEDTGLPTCRPIDQANTGLCAIAQRFSQISFDGKGTGSANIAHQMSRVTSEEFVESQNAIPSILEDLENKPEDFSHGWNTFQLEGLSTIVLL